MNVKLLRIVTGEEVIAELLSEDENTITVKNGLVVIPNAQGVGFAPWATVISKQKPEITVDRKFIVYMVECDVDVVEKYESIFSPIEKPSKKLIL
jgi:hypothetical protein|tara:strand:- start:111 stop:395 length:285 start_codon:yes stop_codon:yes gene_type:complete